VYDNNLLILTIEDGWFGMQEWLVPNSIRAFGLKFELFKAAKESLSGKEEMVKLKENCFTSIKELLIGTGGKVGGGIKEILDAMKVNRLLWIII
jgi:hypothetical protein